MKTFLGKFFRRLKLKKDRELNLEITERYNSHEPVRREAIESEIFFHDNIKKICSKSIEPNIYKKSSFDYVFISGLYIKRETLLNILSVSNNNKDKNYLKYLLIKHYKKYNKSFDSILKY